MENVIICSQPNERGGFVSSECVIAKIRDLSSMLDDYINKRIKEKELPILKNHIPLFYILSAFGEPILFNELMRRWGISKSSLSDIICRYERQGLLVKTLAEEDKRSIYITATEASKKIKEQLDGIEEELLNLIFAEFNSEDRALFEQIIDKALTTGRTL